MTIDKLIELGGNNIQERFVKKYDELYNSILEYTKTYDISFKERLYLYWIKQTFPNTCKMCSNTVSINTNIKDGYKTYCTVACSRKDTEMYHKIKQTNILKYGVDNVAKNKDIMNKSKNTQIEKYGCLYIKTVEFKEKSISTNNIKYGHDLYQQTDEFKKISSENIDTEKMYKATLDIIKDNPNYYIDIQTKVKKTLNEKYNVNNAFQLEISKNKKQQTTFIKNCDNINDDNIKFISKENLILKLHSFDCNHIFDIYVDTYYQRKSNNQPICTICNPISHQKSFQEDEVYQFLIDNEIICDRHVRGIIGNKELDLYSEQHSIAIEYNGLYWHNEQNKGMNYHRDKYNKCLDLNIHLLNIFEDDWLYKKDIIKSILLNKFNKTHNNIYGRKCEIKKVNANDANIFLDKNHIQGSCKSSYKIGLYHNSELVSLMTFGYRYTNSKKEFELIRFCNKLNTNIIGAASKLFNHFIKNYNIDDTYIVSYADLNLFNGDLYDKLGFTEIHTTKPNYYWVVNGVRYHRFKYNKQKLVNEGYDINKTEVQIMAELGHYRIWGVGQKRFEYNIQK